MKYWNLPPPPDLCAHVRSFWVLQSNGLDAPLSLPLLPDGCPELIVGGATSAEIALADGRFRPLPSALVMGPSTQPCVVRLSGRVEWLGVRFQPGAARAFFGIPLDSIKERVVALSQVIGDVATRFLAEFQDAATLRARLERIENLLIRRIRTRERHSLSSLVSHMIAHRGQISAKELGHQTGFQERRLRRWFRAHVGIAPQTLCRIFRFRAALENLRQDTSLPWAQIALECGYCDQAHMSRDFRRFTDLPPRRLLDWTEPILRSRTVMTGPLVSESSKTTL